MQHDSKCQRQHRTPVRCIRKPRLLCPLCDLCNFCNSIVVIPSAFLKFLLSLNWKRSQNVASHSREMHHYKLSCRLRLLCDLCNFWILQLSQFPWHFLHSCSLYTEKVDQMQHVTRCRRKGAHNPGEVGADWTDEWEYGCGTRHGGQTERIPMHPRDAGVFLLGTPSSLACFRCWSYYNRLVFGVWAFFLTYRTIT